MRSLVALLAGGIFALMGSPTYGAIAWLEKNYDFGMFREQAGPQTGSVRFVNTGPEEVVISEVKPSCGCTSTEFPKDPVAPGDTAFISFTYDPAGRPGKFEKSIRVYVGDDAPYRIGIQGNVLGAPESLDALYPVKAGPLRLSASTIGAGELRQGPSRDFFINAYNQTAEPIEPVFRTGNTALKAVCSESKIGPGEVAALSFYFQSSPRPEVGKHRIPVYMTLKGDTAPLATLWFVAEVVPDTRRLSPAEVDNGPRCYLIPSPLDLGIVSGNGQKEFSFLISNDGKSPLNVLKIEPQNPAIRIKRVPGKIKNGKTAEVKGSLNIDQILPGGFNIKVKVYTDDPLHPVRELSVAGIRE